MSFFHNLNKTLDSIAARPEASQLNERDEGKPGKNFEKIAKSAAERYGSKEAGERVAGKIRADLAKKSKLEEESVDEGLVDVVKKVGGMAKKASSTVLNKVGHGDDVDMIRDLQRKMGVPQTGMKPGSEPNPKQIKEIGDTPAGLEKVKAYRKTVGQQMHKTGEYDTRNPEKKSNPFDARTDGHDPHKQAMRMAGASRANKIEKARAQGMPAQFQTQYEGDDDGISMTPKQKSFAALAPPENKITFADKIAGAKKEVDEMLGDVAAEAMRSALSGGQKKLDATDFEMLRKGGKKMADESRDDEDDVYAFQDPSKKKTHKTATGGTVTRHGGVTRHQAAPGHYGGFDPETDPDKDDDKPGTPAGEKRGRGRPKGAPKGPERVTAKAYKHKGERKVKEGDMEEGADQGQAQQIYNDLADIRAMAKQAQGGGAFPQGFASRLEATLWAAMTMIKNQQSGDAQVREAESTDKKDNRAERAGKKVTKDIEYDEKKDDGKKDEPKKSKSKFKFGGSVYETLDAQLETLITEGMSVTVNMSQNAEDGQEHKNITVNADGEDADRLAELLQMAGISQQSSGCGCGQSPCGCDVIDENDPNWPSNTETSDNALQYSGGLNGPKSTGQSTVPVLASQLRRQVSMEESAKVEQNLLNLYRTFGK